MLFHNEYSFLSNFYNTKVTINGITYNNSESAYMSFKTDDRSKRTMFVGLTGKEAKKLGKKIELREDWDEIKDEVMYLIVKAKFNQNEYIKQKLIDTEELHLEETNYWHDYYWGVCNGKGENKLGKILMRVREELKDEK